MGFIGSLLLDVILISLLILLILYSIKKGFSGSLGGVIFAILALGLAGALAYLIYSVGFYDKLGWQSGLEQSFSGIDETFSGADNDGKIASILAMVVFVLIGFIVCYILVRILFFLLGKLVKKCRDLKGFAVVDSVLGVVVNVGIFVAIILCLFAFFHAFTGSNHFVNVREFLDSTYLSKLLYKINPLNDMFDGFGLVETFDKYF